MTKKLGLTDLSRPRHEGRAAGLPPAGGQGRRVGRGALGVRGRHLIALNGRVDRGGRRRRRGDCSWQGRQRLGRRRRLGAELLQRRDLGGRAEVGVGAFVYDTEAMIKKLIFY